MNKEKIIDYIYNEMNPSERSDFEKMMAEDNSLRIEVKQLMESRTLIAKELDYLPPLEEVKAAKALSIKSLSVSRWWAIAASLFLLCAMSYLTGLRIGVQDKSVILSFSEKNQEKSINLDEKYISKEEFLTAIDRLEHSLITTKQATQEEPINEEVISKMIDVTMRRLDERYKSWTKETYVAFQEEAKYQTETIMQEFLDYYEIKRGEDIKQINDGLTNLALMVQERTEGLPQYAYQPAQ
jgi:hypothetical protein